MVLLILAGVSLNAIFSENGLINRAKDAQNKMDQATQNDLAQLDELDSWLENQVNGVEKGAKIISFTINSTTYQAEEGMTWRQWIESKYNTIGTITIGESRISNGGDILGYNTKQGPQTVKPDEVINTKYSYQFT
ncbi:unknown [Clostridium sp. CAG:508]|nr:unknown [Clostridium sp. CAG:508]